MSGFTKGPWKADLDETCSVRDENGGRIFMATHLKGRGGLGGRRDSEEVAANVYLAAAAPQLYEACLYMHRLLVDMGHGGLAGPILGEAAIAKAEGRSQ